VIVLAHVPPYRILIVDDAAAVREAIRWALEDEPGLAVVGEAADGVEAVARVQELQPDIAILDVEMPSLDGFAATRRIKAMARPPLVILLTIHGDSASRRRGLEVGADGFVEKGIGWPAFIAEIRRSLANWPPGPDPQPAT
jgi:DNA-binding NarL/FixJ family response regulator